MKLLPLLALALLVGCAGPRTYAGAVAADVSQTTTAAADDRKVLREAYLDLRVEEPDSTVSKLVTLADRLGGYPARTSTNGVTLRIPDDQLEVALATAATLGKVADRRLTTTDVTAGYTDLGIRLDNAERARARYLELLAQAQTVAETIEVERELERLNETIDLLKGQRNRLDDREALATLTVDVSQRERPGPLGYVFVGLWKGISWLFVR